MNVIHKNPSEEKKWYLVYTKPRQEELANQNLQRQGFNSYLPMAIQPRRRDGKVISRIEPLFPRYLFISLDTKTDNWSPIRSTIGVSSLVRFGMNPAVVPTELVLMIEKRDNEYGVQKLPIKEFETGDKVRITDGPMMGYEGIFLARSSQERVTILLSIVNKNTHVKLNPAQIAKSD